MRAYRSLIISAFAGAIFIAGQAQAHDHHTAEPGIEAEDVISSDAYPGAPHPDVPSASYPLHSQPAAPTFAYGDQERTEWLAECRRRHGDNGVGGAIIGGALGGIAGNRIAGSGNRTVGTIAGAAVGAIAGAVIDKAEDAGRVRDDCENYLADYEAGYAAGHGIPAYGHGYGAGPVMWVPVTTCGCRCKPKVREIVEWVDDKPARRAIPATAKPAKSKTVPIKTKLVPIKTK